MLFICTFSVLAHIGFLQIFNKYNCVAFADFSWNFVQIVFTRISDVMMSFTDFALGNFG